MDRLIIGRLEEIALPELGIGQLTARVDSGAQTSSLHVDNIKKIKIGGKQGIEFDLHPDFYDIDKVKRCQAVIHDVRQVKSSNGASEQRFVIETMATLGSLTWPIEITLTDRSDMTYLMLIGRQALGAKFYIDASEAFIISNSEQ
ncbi:ATP-dependent zinc protease family protein [Thalassotalea mangrovi]|uniref:ATP-dependent zinc protease n=1 Tax=Thalassotalea mangrovi TaxID=2572245 RepID=A0A4U1B4L5_9GAMM|nr:RimK/LysX family protein [Thalassotalea mangrovi]TKB45320.1 ATP-dependent zinc protease [Thalassotalea mangrovi]